MDAKLPETITRQQSASLLDRRARLTLWDIVKELSFTDFSSIIRKLAFVHAAYIREPETMDAVSLKDTHDFLAEAIPILERIGLKTSYWLALDFQQAVERNFHEFGGDEFSQRAFHLFKAIQCETMGWKSFLREKEEADYFKGANAIEQVAEDRWPGAVDEMREAAKWSSPEKVDAMSAVDCWLV